MNLDQNVTAVVSSGKNCFLCEKPTVNGEFVILVRFHIPIPPFGIRVGIEEVAHCSCSVVLKDTLTKRLEEIQGKISGKTH